MSNRIVVMSNGRAEQVGTPFEIYNTPATRFVASFVGTLSMLDGKVGDAATGAVYVDDEVVELGRPLDGMIKGSGDHAGLRPEAGSVGRRVGRDAHLSGTITDVAFHWFGHPVRVALGRNTVSLDMFNKIPRCRRRQP